MFASVICLLGILLSATAIAAPPIDVGTRLELMVDDHLVESLDGLTLKLHHPCRTGTVLTLDSPWEGDYLGHVSVLRDGDLYRMYYRGYHKPGFSWDDDIYTCYAESCDGIHWNKPSLALVEWEGSKANNIVTHGQKGAYLTPFIDRRPGVPAAERYKSLAGNPAYAMVSGDGIHWRALSEKRLPLPFGIALWDPRRKEYMAYVRAKNQGARSIALSTSPDFLSWSKPRLLDFGNRPVEHLYWNTAIPYFRAPHIYLGFPMRLIEYEDPATGKTTDRTDCVLLVSRDGYHFGRHWTEAFVRPGLDPHNWQPHTNMMSYAIVPSGENEISLYLTNRAGGSPPHLQRLVLRTDGFASLNAPYEGGECLTKLLVFSGDRLVLNASTSAAGEVRVEILSPQGKPLEGYRLEDCRPFVGDTISHVVQWKRGDDLSDLAGMPVRLRIVMRDADLYSFRFNREKADSASGEPPDGK